MADQEEWEYSVTWRIEDFSSCTKELGLELQSPVFTIEAFDKNKWYLRVYPGGYQQKDKEYFTCFLCNSEDNLTENTWDVSYRIQINTSENKNLRTYMGSAIFKKGKCFGPPDKLKITEVMSELKKCSLDTLFVTCSMRRKILIKLQTVKEEIQTRIISEKCSFQWNVKFLGDPLYLNGKRYFSFGELFYHMNIAIIRENVIITIKALNENVFSSNKILGKVSLLGVKWDSVFSKQDNHIFDYENGKSTWEFPSLITKKQLLENVCEYVKDGLLVLICEFSVQNDENDANLSKVSCHNFSYMDSILNLSKDFQSLLVDKTNTDVTLEVDDVNVIEFQAHRSILTARSPVFSAMFKREMIENRTGIVKVDDVDSKTMEYFLKFLYTGVLKEMDYEIATKLLMVANKYQVPTLKEVSASFLMTVLSVDNVCEVLSLADMACSEELKNTCIDYAADKVDNIFSSPDRLNWMKENPNLVAEIFVYIGKNFRKNY